MVKKNGLVNLTRPLLFNVTFILPDPFTKVSNYLATTDLEFVSCTTTNLQASPDRETGSYTTFTNQAEQSSPSSTKVFKFEQVKCGITVVPNN